VPNVLRVLPSSAITFLVYEKTHQVLTALLQATDQHRRTDRTR